MHLPIKVRQTINASQKAVIYAQIDDLTVIHLGHNPVW